MKFHYELRIKLQNEDCPANLSEGCMYFGFKVAETGYDQFRFCMEGDEELDTFKKNFDKLTKEVKESQDTTIEFQFAIIAVNKIVQKVNGDHYAPGYCTSNSQNWMGTEIFVHLKRLPDEKPEPKIDGSVTGFLWNVYLNVKLKSGETTCYQDTVYCIKPESAVHETLDRFFRKYPEFVDYVDPIVEVSKSKTRAAGKFDYIITE